MNQVKIGIAGYMGSGKSTCISFFDSDICCVIMADQIAKDIMNGDINIRIQLSEEFGTDILNENSIRFDILGKRAFSSMDRLLSLNNIVHPHLLPKLQNLVRNCDKQVCIIDAALISYWKIEDWFNSLLWIHAPREMRIQRVLQKGIISSFDLQERMKIQESLFEKPSGKKWTIIENKGTLIEFNTAIEKSNVIPENLLQKK